MICKLESLLKYEQPTKYIVASEDYSDEFVTPVLTAGKSFILGYTDEEHGICKASINPVIIYDDFTTESKFVDFDFKVKSSAMKILHKTNEDDNLKYLYYVVSCLKYKPFSHKRTWISDFSKFQVKYRIPEEQNKIVSELDKIQDALANKNEQLKKLDELIQSKFYEMFGDPITNEKEWNVKTFGNLFNTILGKMLDKKKQIETDISLPYLGNANVQWGYFIFENLNTMTFTRKEIEKFNLQVGDLLICEGGESGRCAIWKGSSQEILFQKAIHRARVKNENEINPQFVAMLLKVLKFNGGLKKYVSQSTIEHLTGVKLSLVPIICPPFYLQQAFASYVEKVEEAKVIVNQEIAHLQELLDSRMDYYFRK